MPFTVAWERPAFRTASKRLCYGLGNVRQQDDSARFLELGIDGRYMQVAFAEISDFCGFSLGIPGVDVCRIYLKR
jgi:hypothetical protein